MGELTVTEESSARSQGEGTLGIGWAHGTFGELLQGSIRGPENHFLVTLPIHRFSKVTFTRHPEDDDLGITPEHKIKAKELATSLLRYLKEPPRGRLTIESDLPEGKGMASSSADLVATARAISAAYSRPLDEDMLLDLLRSLEPTDGVMYSEFVSFFHRRVQLHRSLGMVRLQVVAVDEGGTVDTVAYNRQCEGYAEDECLEYERLLERISSAFASGDLPALGEVATQSAILHQKRNPKRTLELFLELRERYGALGVVVAHSGPCIGLLFADSPAHRERAEAVGRLLEERGLDVDFLSSLDNELPPPGALELGKVGEGAPYHSPSWL